MTSASISKDEEPHQFFIISIYLIKKPSQMYETLHKLSCKSRLDFYTRNTENEHQSALLSVHQYFIKNTNGTFWALIFTSCDDVQIYFFYWLDEIILVVVKYVNLNQYYHNFLLIRNVMLVMYFYITTSNS